MTKLDNSKIKPPFSHFYCNKTYFIMIDWLIALLPCIVWGIYMFGMEGLWSGFICLGVAAVCEFAYCYIRKCSYDHMVIIRALILSMSISLSAPLYIALLGGVLIGALGILRRLHGKYFTYEPIVLVCTFIALFMLHTSSPVDSVLEGTKISGLAVADIIIGKHDGGLGAVSFIAIFIGYLYLSIRKRINAMLPIVFSVAMIIGICIFYESTDLVTQLDFISYTVFDGKILFAVVFMLTLPCVFPTIGNSNVILTAVLGMIFAYLLITLKNADLIYLLLTIFSLLSRLIVHIKYKLIRY